MTVFLKIETEPGIWQGGATIFLKSHGFDLSEHGLKRDLLQASELIVS